MTERATIIERPQIGVESTAGTAVAADRRLESIKQVIITPNLARHAHRAQGRKTSSGVVPDREHTDHRWTGQLCYDELTWFFASLFGTVTPAQQSTTAAYVSTWADSPEAEVVPVPFTLESGQAARAEEVPYSLITGMEMAFPAQSREPSLSMSGIGHPITDGITMTGSLADEVLRPVLGGQLSVYLDDTAANLGTTKLTRNLNAGVSFPTRHQPVWANDASKASYATTVEKTDQDPMLTLLVAADSAGMALLGYARNSTRRFIRLECVGPTIESSYDYTLTMDFAVEVDAVEAKTDSNGLFAQGYRLRNVYDPTWGQSFNISLTNTVDAL